MASDIETHAAIQSIPTRRSAAQRLLHPPETGAGWSDPRRIARGLGWFSVGLGLAEILAPRLVARLVGTSNHSMLIRGFGFRELGAGIGILSGRDAGPWLWARVAGDAADLAALGSALTGDENETGKTLFGFASVAGVTALDILCAKQLTGAEEPSRGSLRVESSILVNSPPQDVFRFWRDFENLPRFMSYLQSVRVTGDRRSHWIAKAAGAPAIEWDAEITEEVPGQRISWQSLRDSSVSNSGSVEFEAAPGRRGTIIRVQMDFGNRAHALGAAIAALMGRHPEQIVDKDLRRFKQVLETGEIITTEGQSAGRREGTTWLDSVAR